MEFFLGDFANLSGGNTTGVKFFNVTATFFDFDFLLDEFGDRGEFGYKGKGAVVENGDLGGNDLATFVFGGFVVGITKFHNVNAVLT